MSPTSRATRSYLKLMLLRFPAAGDEGEEEVVHYREDPLFGDGLVGHQQVVAGRPGKGNRGRSLLAKRSVASSTAVLFFSGFSLYGALLLMPLYYQDVRGTTALAAGVMLVPQGVGALLSRTVAGSNIDRFGLGAVTMPVMVAGYIGLDKEQVPHSSVLTRTSQQIGGSFGTAVLAVILAGAIAAHPALQAGAERLVSEDLQDGRRFGALAIETPSPKEKG